MKVVVIGCSGHYYSFIEALESGLEAEFAGFAKGVDDEVCQGFISAFKEKYGFRVYENYLEMLDEVKPDIAIVNSHFNLNSRITLDAFERGVSCYTEKPVATTLEDLQLLKKGYERSGVHFSAMLEMRYTPAFRAACQAIKSGKVGDVLMITAQKSYKLGQRREFFKKRETFGGTIPWVGIHAIDWIRWLSGREFKSVDARHSTMFNNGHGDLETAAICFFELEGGGFASVNMDYLRPASAKTHGDDRVRVVGSKGIVEVMHGKAVIIDQDGERDLELSETVNPFVDFLHQVESKGKCLVSAEDAFKATEAGLYARQSADEGKRLYFSY